jgi:hypothetical protein
MGEIARVFALSQHDAIRNANQIFDLLVGASRRSQLSGISA